MTQQELDFTPPTHRTRKAAHEAAMTRQEKAYAALRSVYLAAGRDGMTADHACWMAGIPMMYGRPRVSEMLNSDNPRVRCLVAKPDAKPRPFTWPNGYATKPSAVLMLMERTDALDRIMALAAAERLAQNLPHTALTPGRETVE